MAKVAGQLVVWKLLTNAWTIPCSSYHLAFSNVHNTLQACNANE